VILPICEFREYQASNLSLSIRGLAHTVFFVEAPHEIRLGEWQDTPHAIVLRAML